MLVLPIHNEAFKAYGNVLSGYDFNGLCLTAKKEIALPKEGTDYEPGVPALESLPAAKELKDRIYGGMDIQVGHCSGQNSHLNGLEYHKGNEVIVAVTPLVLLLAAITDMHDFSTIDSKKVKAFYMEEKEAVELYGTTLHFAPCRADKGGFMAIIVLPKGTNFPLDSENTRAEGEDRLLLMKNKWLIAHPESDAARDGAYAGITGENIEVPFTVEKA